MYFFTADEHYFHRNIITFCNRPFSSLEEMHWELRKRHNEKVSEQDITIHLGDFALTKEREKVYELSSKLNGNHIFLRGSHDKWMDKTYHEIWEKKIDNYYITCCHYALRTWPRSHYNSWSLYGHSHGRLPSIGKQYDIGVDNNNFYPISFEQIKKIMSTKEDNLNLLKKEKKKLTTVA